MKESIVLLFVLLLSVTTVHAKEVTIFVENFTPYNYIDENNRLTGPASEIVSKLIETIQADVEIKSNIPWSRCMEAIDQGIFTGIKIGTPVAVFSMMRIPPREKIYKWVGPLVPFEMGFYVTNPKIFIKNPDNFEKNLEYVRSHPEWIIGISAKNAAGYKILTKHNIPDKQFYDMSKGGAGGRMLFSNRINLWCVDKAAGYHMAKISDLDVTKMRWLFTVNKKALYIAFSLNTPDELISKWQNGLDSIEIERNVILTQYGLK